MNQINTKKKIENLATNLKEYPLNLMQDFYKVCEKTPEDTLYVMNEDQITGLNAVLGTLEEREREMILLHYKHSKKWDDIAKEFNVTRHRVYQIKNNVFHKINHQCNYALIKNGYYHSLLTFIAVNSHYGANPTNTTLKPDDSILESSISSLGLSVRAINSLTRHNTVNMTIKELISMSINDISRVRNLGAKTVIEISDKLESLNINDSAWNALSREFNR